MPPALWPGHTTLKNNSIRTEGEYVQQAPDSGASWPDSLGYRGVRSQFRT